MLVAMAFDYRRAGGSGATSSTQSPSCAARRAGRGFGRVEPRRGARDHDRAARDPALGVRGPLDDHHGRGLHLRARGLAQLAEPREAGRPRRTAARAPSYLRARPRHRTIITLDRAPHDARHRRHTAALPRTARARTRRGLRESARKTSISCTTSRLQRLSAFLHQDNCSSLTARASRSPAGSSCKSKAAIGAGGLRGTGLLQRGSDEHRLRPRGVRRHDLLGGREQLGFLARSPCSACSR